MRGVGVRGREPWGSGVNGGEAVKGDGQIPLWHLQLEDASLNIITTPPPARLGHWLEHGYLAFSWHFHVCKLQFC